MISKKLLLITFAVLSCAAGKSLAAELEYTISEAMHAEIRTWAEAAVGYGADQKRGKRHHKTLLRRRVDKDVQKWMSVPQKKRARLTAEQAFDAECKDIEELDFSFKQQGYHDVIAARENALDNHPAPNISNPAIVAQGIQYLAKFHAELLRHDPAEIENAFIGIVKRSIQIEALGIPVDGREEFKKETMQKYETAVQEALKKH